MTDFAQLMEEPPGGPNHGRAATNDLYSPEGATHRQRHGVPLDVAEYQASEFAKDGGWSPVHFKDGSRAGITAHRGVVHPEEHVDTDALRVLVEDELGFTYAEVHSVYSTGGRIPADRRELRGRIDARLLDLSRAGANMDALGRVIGLNASTLDRALARSKELEA